MKILTTILMIFLWTLLLQILPAQNAWSSKQSPEISTLRSNDWYIDQSDRPSSPIKVIAGPSKGGAYSGTKSNPGGENDNPPVPEEIQDEPPAEPVEPPTFFGEPVSGTFVWVLDRSGSMGIQDAGNGPIEDHNGSTIANPNRIQIVKAECISVLRQLSESDRFAIVSFGYGPDVSCYWELVDATPGNVTQAISEVANMVANGGTPAYPALRTACTKYGSEIDKMFFLCDGSPNIGGGASQILADFPTWFSPLKDAGCLFHAVHIGTDGYSATFMTTLANLVGGVYIKR